VPSVIYGRAVFLCGWSLLFARVAAIEDWQVRSSVFLETRDRLDRRLPVGRLYFKRLY